MSTIDDPQYLERCASCKRPITAADPLDECWCHPSTPQERVPIFQDPEEVRSELRDGSPGPVRLADRSKAKDGLDRELCWHARTAGGCPAFVRCQSCPEDER